MSINNRKILICSMGIPRSGKTIWVKEIHEKYGIPVVCPDDIRLALHGKVFDVSKEKIVWEITRTMVKCLFMQGYIRVLFDATNYHRGARKTPKKWAKEIGCDIVFYDIKTPKDVCIQRCKDGDRKDLIPIVERMFCGYHPLDEDETAFTEADLL